MAEATDMDEAVFDVLREAVRMARDEQIATVARLRLRLLEAGPGREALVEQALLVWAEREARCERA